MAVLLLITVSIGSQDQFDELGASVDRAMMEAGGPPPGLMSHVVYPEGDGFVIADVWRTEAEGVNYLDDQLRPLMAQLGLMPEPTEVRPAWSFARP